MRSQFALSAASFLLVLGCAGPKKLPEGAVESPRNPMPQESPVIPSPVEPKKPLERFTIEEAFELTERIHPDLAAARARVDAAEGRIIQAGLFPNLEAVGRMESAPFRGKTAGDAEYVAGVSQRLPIGGRLRAASNVEQLERDRRTEEYEVERLQVRQGVHGSFAAALYMEEATRIHVETLEVAERGVAVARRLLAAGDTIPAEVARSEMEEARARLELDRARSLREVARMALATAIGDPSLPIESVEGQLDAALEIPTLESIVETLEESPEIALAEARVAVKRGRVDLAEVERIPDVNLDLLYRRLQGPKIDAFDVGLSVALPIFDRNQGRLHELASEVTVAEAGARSIRNQMESRVREAHARMAIAVSRSRFLKDEILPRAATVLESGQRRYDAGDIGLVEILPIRRDNLAVRLDYLQSLRDAMEAWVGLRPFVAAAQ